MENLRITQKELIDTFQRTYHSKPRLFRAPGRINLIGEHTDYNEGFVLPFAIDREALVAGVPRSDTRVNILALDVNDSFSFDLSKAGTGRRSEWTDYIEGTIRCVHKSFDLQHGADLVFSSTVPIGAGLSSSAALEISAGLAMLSLNGIDVDKKKLALAAQKAENEFVGVRSGIMDQFASVFCVENHGLLLDCRSLEARQIPLRTGGAMFVVCDTKVKHQLASSEYNKRRDECEKAVEHLRGKIPNIKSLRDVSVTEFEKFRSVLPETLARRCRHVITENVRTLAAAKCLENSNLPQLGELMYLSHESLRCDYEVSCAELDALVEAARQIEGVYGARMTGGGFGGCTINLLEEAVLEKFRERIDLIYSERFGYSPEFYPVCASDGASEMI